MVKVEISLNEYKRLLVADNRLDALEAFGVDNWEGYDEALSDVVYIAERECIEALEGDQTALYSVTGTAYGYTQSVQKWHVEANSQDEAKELYYEGELISVDFIRDERELDAPHVTLIEESQMGVDYEAVFGIGLCK